jgi:hypothetical protein
LPLPNCAIVSRRRADSVAFGIRKALDADQIFGREGDNRYYFDGISYPGSGILVDDIVRSGKVITNVN